MSNQFLTMFEITNRKELNCSYRLLEITGIPKGSDDYDKNVNLVVKGVAYETKKPVALITRDDKPCLAISVDSSLQELKRSVVTHVVTLVPVSEGNSLRCDSLTPETFPIAIQFLAYAFRTPLMTDRRLWNAGHSHFGRNPINTKDASRNIDIFGGFRHKVLRKDEDKLFLAIDLTYKYVDPHWLTEIAPNEEEISNYENRHFIYHFGWKGYEIQMMHTTGQDIKHQEFKDERTGKITNVFDYTREEWKNDEPYHVNTLDPQSPAILYKEPGSGRERYGAAALCKLMYATDHPYVSAIHSQSMVPPQRRFHLVTNIVGSYFSNADLEGVRIQLDTHPYQTRVKIFPVPDLILGHDRVLHVRRNGEDGVDLNEFGRTRARMLTDAHVGPLTTSPFDAQFVVVPYSLDRSIVEDFLKRFKQVVEQFYPQVYRPELVLYDDSRATTLQRQVDCVQSALAQANVSNGYALLILPFRAHDDLHNYIKRKLWPNIQFQCATAAGVARFYAPRQDGEYEVVRELEGKLKSYIKYTALGLLQVNHKWLWALQTPLHYDVYIGIDVLKGTAGFTFVYENGKKIFFRDYTSEQREKLGTNQIRHILYERLKEDLTHLFSPPLICPRTIVIHRDGRTYESELKGVRQTIDKLKKESILRNDAGIGVVEIPKHSSYPLRIVVGDSLSNLDNPVIGVWEPIDAKQGIVCNTGKPFIRQGTARPLGATIVEGNLKIEYILEDVFALSQLIYSAPEGCGRLPLTTRLSHEFLEPVAGEAALDEARYGDEEEFDEEDEELKDIYPVKPR